MGVRGVPVPPLFGLRGTVPPLFRTKKVKNLLSPAVNRGDLWRLNYNKTIFGRDSALDPAGRAHDALTSPKVGWGGDTSSLFSFPFTRDPRAFRSPSELVTPLLDQSYAPVLSTT